MVVLPEHKPQDLQGIKRMNLDEVDIHWNSFPKRTFLGLTRDTTGLERMVSPPPTHVLCVCVCVVGVCVCSVVVCVLFWVCVCVCVCVCNLFACACVCEVGVYVYVCVLSGDKH